MRKGYNKRKQDTKSDKRRRDYHHPDYTQVVHIPNDPNNTVLTIHKDDDPQEAIEKYLRRRGVYLKDKLNAAIKPIVNPETR